MLWCDNPAAVDTDLFIPQPVIKSLPLCLWLYMSSALSSSAPSNTTSSSLGLSPGSRCSQTQLILSVPSHLEILPFTHIPTRQNIRSRYSIRPNSLPPLPQMCHPPSPSMHMWSTRRFGETTPLLFQGDSQYYHPTILVLFHLMQM